MLLSLSARLDQTCALSLSTPKIRASLVANLRVDIAPAVDRKAFFRAEGRRSRSQQVPRIVLPSFVS